MMIRKTHKILIALLLCTNTILAQQKLFLVTKNGGSLNGGTVLAFDPDASQQKTKVNFGKYGLGQRGNIVQDDNGFIYGLMPRGSNWNSGCIFKVKSDGTEYSQLYDFRSGSSGGDGTSSGSLTISGN